MFPLKTLGVSIIGFICQDFVPNAFRDIQGVTLSRPEFCKNVFEINFENEERSLWSAELSLYDQRDRNSLLFRNCLYSFLFVIQANSHFFLLMW